MGKLLKRSKWTPDRVVSSTARRARQTTELALKAAKYKGDVEFTDEIYEASPEDLLDLVRRQPDGAETVLLVGHNPGFEDVLSLLCGTGDVPARITVPTAALACVECEVASWADVGPGCGSLAWFAVPKMLGDDD
jgi:phosphohistidine phosphatase